MKTSMKIGALALTALSALTGSLALSDAAQAAEPAHVQLVAQDRVGALHGLPYIAVTDKAGTVDYFTTAARARAAAATFDARTVRGGVELWSQDGTGCLAWGSKGWSNSGYLTGRDATFCGSDLALNTFSLEAGGKLAVEGIGGDQLVGAPTGDSAGRIVLSTDQRQTAPISFLSLAGN
ncbi:hypothetical protein [Curtobacterium luteum]|uniref:Uncharacterized protein n=1 Tax=Curtobacterium luteum TaxID=33881 RepID=A0A175RLL3_9MICO|nr:hypothetical protein [Curtobacterium luteum]KTR04557.1 hypothetical protein NS184_11795 [Curtobacterium luteum]